MPRKPPKFRQIESRLFVRSYRRMGALWDVSPFHRPRSASTDRPAGEHDEKDTDCIGRRRRDRRLRSPFRFRTLPPSIVTVAAGAGARASPPASSAARSSPAPSSPRGRAAMSCTKATAGRCNTRAATGPHSRSMTVTAASSATPASRYRSARATKPIRSERYKTRRARERRRVFVCPRVYSSRNATGGIGVRLTSRRKMSGRL